MFGALIDLVNAGGSHVIFNILEVPINEYVTDSTRNALKSKKTSESLALRIKIAGSYVILYIFNTSTFVPTYLIQYVINQISKNEVKALYLRGHQLV